jgi:hypothetical protein
MKLGFSSILFGFAVMSAAAMGQTAHYVDCSGGNDGADGLKPETAWKTLAKVNATTLRAGDSLLLKRDTTCTGELKPNGSGAQGRPIKLGAYGVGALPKVVGTGNEAGLKLENQQWWEIENLDIKGGDPYGVWITGSAEKLNHFRLTNVVVHDVTGTPKMKDSGLVVIGPENKSKTTFNDIVIDGVTAYNTTQWAGIIVTAGPYTPPNIMRGTDVTIRNSVIHDVAGDGILLSTAKKGLIERNVAWNTGMQYTESIGTPNGIWEWECEDCMVQYNEGFYSDSPGVDGGVYDIDWGNINNTVQYNFAHDTQGYCVAVFGAGGDQGSSLHSVVRGNLCIDNGRSPREAQRQGAIYLSTWDNGHLSDVQIYGNTVFWDPSTRAAALVNDAVIDASAPRVFSNNLIVSRSPLLVQSTNSLQLHGNQYWTVGDIAPTWFYNGQTFTSLGGIQAAGHESGSAMLNPKLGREFEPAAMLIDCKPMADMPRDLYGNSLPHGCMTGAIAPRPSTKRSNNAPVTPLPFPIYAEKGWRLVTVLSPEGEKDADASRSEMVVLESMLQQFGPLGVHVQVAPNRALSADEARTWAADWNFGGVSLLEAAKKANGSNESIRLWLVSQQGRVVAHWTGLTAAPEIQLTLRSLVGTPVGMQKVEVP